MKIVDIANAGADLPRLVEEAIAGGEVVLARGNQPLVRLVPVAEEPRTRRLGTATEKVGLTKDFDEEIEDFDAYR